MDRPALLRGTGGAGWRARAGAAPGWYERKNGYAYGDSRFTICAKIFGVPAMMLPL